MVERPRTGRPAAVDDCRPRRSRHAASTKISRRRESRLCERTRLGRGSSWTPSSRSPDGEQSSAHDLSSLAQFWADALGWRILSVREKEVVVGATVDAPVGLCFMPAGSMHKTVKNRVHMDLTTTADDRDSEIARLIGLGARQVDVGQTGGESWDVLADPEGNEFCVVRPKVTLVE